MLNVGQPIFSVLEFRVNFRLESSSPSQHWPVGAFFDANYLLTDAWHRVRIRQNSLSILPKIEASAFESEETFSTMTYGPEILESRLNTSVFKGRKWLFKKVKFEWFNVPKRNKCSHCI